MRWRLFLAALGLGSSLALAQGPAPAAPAGSRTSLTLKFNGEPVAIDTAFSRLEVSTGVNKVLSLNLVRTDSPDDQGLTILIDQFPLTVGQYRFKEILSGHVRDASYRQGRTTAYSTACGLNDGVVQVLALDAQRHLIRGTYRAVLCEAEARPGTKRRRFTVEGTFQGRYFSQ
ncbi:hypothetical protein [Hymenobacter chitinivorans]|uniref:Uncharacterized protein n=1 Tax=Hymenobacter chitinivorans DSM 11115 TaxID=1121954 RepID=A0A2M9BL20_9BACT|nr:hypothetical protein [Hymenobacter chitinivorans]PJJ58644.1 hypothetical protein CLV45_0054 [Hymenobacter chitinivorans DSM 11115]